MAVNLRHRNKQLFSRAQLRGDLKKRSIQGGFNRVIADGTSFALTMGSAVVLARLLAPEEFGLFAMVLAFTEIANLTLEIGLGVATVQREKISHEEISTLFWINLIIGVTLMAAVASLSPAIAWFYDDPRLLNIGMVLSIVFLLRGIAVQHRSLLERQMRFGYLGLIDIISNFAGICVAIILALNGFGVWALVWRELASDMIYAVGTWLLTGWIPSFPRMNAGVRSSLRMGGDILGSSFVQYFTRNLDKVLIGRFSGATTLGLYTKAFQFALMPLEKIRTAFWDIGFSALSSLQSDPERYRRFFSRLLLIQSFLYMPLVVFLLIQSEELIRLLFGEAWIGATPFFRIFAIVGFIRPIEGTLRLVMVSCGNTKRLLKWIIVQSVCMVTAFSGGIYWWGAIGVAYAYVFASYAILVWSLSYCLKDTPIKALLIIKTIAFPVTSSFGAGIILIIALPIISNTRTSVVIIFSILVVAAVYLGIWLCIPASRKRLKDFWSYRAELFSKA